MHLISIRKLRDDAVQYPAVKQVVEAWKNDPYF
jgi:mRNA-degrading endonuclease HigB of HigAB toxin-antitoxin module